MSASNPADRRESVEEHIGMADKLSLRDLAELVGKEVSVSPWIALDQSRIDAFADCTGDRQWIHVDAARAATETPFGGTIAHGFLTLSLIGPTVEQLLTSRLTVRQILNYGLDKVRFLAPVRAGKRVRNRITPIALEDKGGGRHLLTMECTVEIEGEAKPALLATSLAMLIA